MAAVRSARLLRLLPRQAKPWLYGGWHWTWNKCHWHWPWNVKSTISKARSSLTQHEAGMLWENCWLPTTSHLHVFAMHSTFAVKIWAQMRQVTSTAWKTNFASLLCQLQTAAPMRLPRLLQLLPRQAKPSLHGSSGRTGSKCHWAWNDKSTIRIPELPLHNTNLDCTQKAGAYLQLYSFIFVLCKLFT